MLSAFDTDFMVRMLQRSTTYTVARLNCTVTRDAFGAEVKSFNIQQSFRANIDYVSAYERANFTGTSKVVDVRIIAPLGAQEGFSPNDRIRVYAADTYTDYEIVSMHMMFINSVVFEATAVQDA